jgi:hypothetical protein
MNYLIFEWMDIKQKPFQNNNNNTQVDQTKNLSEKLQY